MIDTTTETRHATKNVNPCRRSMTTYDPLSDDKEINKNDSFSVSYLTCYSVLFFGLYVSPFVAWYFAFFIIELHVIASPSDCHSINKAGYTAGQSRTVWQGL